MERRLDVRLYAYALLLSLVVFGSGIYVGYLLDSWNLHGISDEVSNISARVASVQLLLISEGTSSQCPLYRGELDSIDADVEKIGHKLSFLEEEKYVFDDELKRKYFILEAESYLLSKRVRDLCGDDSVLLIHFYSNRACDDCREQGTEILQMRDTLKSEGIDVKLFSFDGELDSPVAEALEAQYGIASYPSIVINERTYPGFMDREELASAIRSRQ